MSYVAFKALLRRFNIKPRWKLTPYPSGVGGKWGFDISPRLLDKLRRLRREEQHRRSERSAKRNRTVKPWLHRSPEWLKQHAKFTMQPASVAAAKRRSAWYDRHDVAEEIRTRRKS